jgi:cobalamin biosynthesis Mg chelatase CobN
MLSTRIVGLACAVAVFVCPMAAPVSAQPLDKRTLFTFSAPVTLPGVTLPAGQYLFRLADPNSSSKVVQVLNAEGTKPYGLFFTIAAERPEPAASPEVRFMETASGTPAAIRTWWYPGERRGYEFIFPKEQARRLAMGASQPVLTTDAHTTTTEQTNTAELSRVGSSGQDTDVSASAAPTPATPGGTTQEGTIAASSLSIATPAIPAVGSAPITTSTASAQTPAGTASTQTTAPPAGSARAARTELPQTASQLPLIAIVGMITLLSAASLQYWRTRRR